MAMFWYFWSFEVHGNVDHVRQNDLTTDDWEYVFQNYETEQLSNSSGRTIRAGELPDGRLVTVVFEWVERDMIVMPVTGFAVERKS